jgi:hypothetical protein
MSRKKSTAPQAALEIAAKFDGSFSAQDVMLEADCTLVAAQVALSNLTAAGRLVRVARGYFARPGLFNKAKLTGSGEVTMARGMSKLAERDLAAAEAWLADKPPLPPARPPVVDVPRSRRGSE